VAVTLHTDGHIHDLLAWAAAQASFVDLEDYLLDVLNEEANAIPERAAQQGWLRRPTRRCP
jgi:hypothetical protein